MTHLLPTLEEIQALLDEELIQIEGEILRTKKMEQEKRDEKRIAELSSHLQTQ